MFWSAATCIAATLKRKVWVDRISYKLYPNCFVVLVGHPGIGKGAAVNPAAHFVKEAGTANLIGDRVTIERLLERLAKGFPSVTAPSAGAVIMTNEANCLIAAPELQVFASASQHTLPILADLWDARETLEYGTKTQGNYVIHKPTVSMLGGSTPEWLSASIPESAVGGGFTRRVNFVYAKSRSQSIPWPVLNGHRGLENDLVEDLREISTIQGEMTYAPSARKLFEKIYDDSIAKEFDDEATSAYRTTQWAHTVKLAMALSAGDGASRVITEQHLETAYDAVCSVRDTISLVFRAVGESDLVAAADRVMRYIELKGYASRQDIMRATWKHVGSTDILDVILTTLVQSGLITEITQGSKLLYQVVTHSTP